MAYDELQTKQDFIEQLCLEGKVWKLSKSTYRPGDIDNWENCFLNDFEYRERHFISEMRIIWRSTDSHGGQDCPLYGVAGNIAQLQYFMKDNRIPRDDLEIDLDTWNEILELDEVIVGGSFNNSETDSSSD